MVALFARIGRRGLVATVRTAQRGHRYAHGFGPKPGGHAERGGRAHTVPVPHAPLPLALVAAWNDFGEEDVLVDIAGAGLHVFGRTSVGVRFRAVAILQPVGPRALVPGRRRGALPHAVPALETLRPFASVHPSAPNLQTQPMSFTILPMSLVCGATDGR